MAQQTLLKRPAKPVIRQTRHLINNQWVDAVEGGHFETLNPATGEVIAKVAAGTAADVDKAVKAARARPGVRPLEHDGRRRPRPAPVQACRPGREDTPRSSPPSSRSTAARRSSTPAATCKGSSTPCATTPAGPTRSKAGPSRSAAISCPTPCGSRSASSARSSPGTSRCLMLAWKWGPALACGNTIVMKPAEQTPLTALRIGELALEAGFPAGVINLINGLGETAGAAMVVHPDIDKIAFTGHVDTAKIIQKAAADTLKRTTFELGGKSPNVIFADADLEAAVAGAFHAIYFHGGQCCTAGSRLFVEEEDSRGIRRAARREGQAAQGRRPARPHDRAGPAGLAGAARQDPRLRRARREARGARS